MPTTRVSLVEKCARGCDSAWHTFFAVYGPIVYRFARHAGLSDADAQDVVGNVMRNLMKAFRGGFEVDYSLGRFRHYFKTVVNREISAQRKRLNSVNLDPQNGPPIEVSDPTPDWEEAEQRERLRLCLDRLRASRNVRPRDLLVFERYALQGEPPERIAKETGLSKSRVYVIKHTMIGELRRLRRELDEELGEV